LLAEFFHIASLFLQNGNCRLLLKPAGQNVCPLH
jgi:hypothetical protein